MSMQYGEIQAALDGRLATFARENQCDVAWENMTLDSSSDRPYLQCALLPARPYQATLGTGGFIRLSGLYQVNVVCPQGIGSGPPRNLADLLIRHFKPGTSLTRGAVNLGIDCAWRSSAVQEPDWYLIPVSVSWFVFAKND